MSEKDVILLSIKDFFTAKMLKYAIVPFIVTLVFMSVVFFAIAGAGVDQLATMSVETSQTTMQNGIPHTESTSSEFEGSGIIKFLMSYAITSWIVSFLIYAIGGFFTLYISIFVAIIVIGFLTPYVIQELQRRHYPNIQIVGYSNIAEGIFLALKWAFVMLLLFLVLIPIYFIPLLNVVALNLPLYYFFHKMMKYDVSSNLCSREETRQIDFFSKSKLRLKTLALYLVSLVPFAIFFGAIFYVIYLAHTYFLELQEIRKVEEVAETIDVEIIEE